MTEPLVRKSVIALRNAKDWLIAQAFFGFIGFLKLFPPDVAIEFCAKSAAALGMYYPRTKLARKNLKLAFPDMADERVEEVLREMWGNLGRTAAEYVYLDQIFDIDEEDQSRGRVEITGGEHFDRLRDGGGPAVCFTGHTGNWELLPIASAAYGMEIIALFRPPNNRYIAERVLSARTTAMGHLVPSKAGASWALARVLDEGGKVGMLVDQFFTRGHIVKFFGHETVSTPLLSKLVRQYDCPVLPARCIRLPEGRFRIEIEKPLDIPRRKDGTLDEEKLTQAVTDRVAAWVTEYPGQWLWLHKRWRPNALAARKAQLAQKKTRPKKGASAS